MQVALYNKKSEGLVGWFVCCFTVKAITHQNSLPEEILESLFLEDTQNSAGQDSE